MTDKKIEQQIPRSFDLTPGVSEVYDHESKREWVYPSYTNLPLYTNQTNVYNQSITSREGTPLSKSQIKEFVKSKRPSTTKEELEKVLNASSKVVKKIIDRVQGTETIEQLLKNEKKDKEVRIEMRDLGNGALAETLPNGTILIDKNLTFVDDIIASRLVHELVHFIKKQDQNYLDKPEEKEAFQLQVQFLLEKGYSEKEVRDLLRPIFEDYKTQEEAKKLLDEMIDKSKKKLKIASQNLLNKISKTTLQSLSFTPEELGVINKIKDAASKLGIKVFLAGGLVRDRLLGLDNEDLDFVTTKDSDRLASYLAEKHHLSKPVKMERSGAVMIHMDHKSIDLINAEKVLSEIGQEKSLEEGWEGEFSVFLDDAFRRDLTINSLMYGLNSGKLFDPTKKGIQDLENKVIRTIIDPYVKYRIQAPDMLRALRFYATKPGFKFAPEMLEAMRENAWRVAPRDQGGDISSRRIERELRKTIKTPEMWLRMKGALQEVGLDRYLEKQIRNVEADLKGDIKYDFGK